MTAEVKAAAERLMELDAMPVEKQKAYVREWPELGWDGIILARAVLASVSEGWQPIETAPRDGTHIIVGQFNGGPGFGHCGKPAKPQYWQAVVHWFDTGTEQGFWLSTGAGDEPSVDRYATHWQPLSPPPNEEKS